MIATTLRIIAGRCLRRLASLTPRVLLAVASLALAAQGHAQAQAATAPVRASKEMVVTANRYASEAGLKVLREGGLPPPLGSSYSNMNAPPPTPDDCGSTSDSTS